MLKRKITNNLIEWKEKSNHKSLILTGARQVGKTFIVRQFGKEQYKSFIEINFLEKPELKSIFEGNLDIETLKLNISVNLPGCNFIPGQTLLLLDEIQECPEAITSLKFWTQDSQYDVIGTGSALGIDYKRMSSFPVGYVEYVDMYSLDFEEFLWAINLDESIFTLLKKHFDTKERIPNAIHTKMLENLKLYMIIGGMPEVVNGYLNSHDISVVNDIQQNIYRDYLNDIAHYANADVKIKTEKCYKSIPLQLSKENHKFQYKLLEHKGTSRKYETSLDWLVNANLVRLAYNVSIIDFPLSSYKQEDNFRVYPTDIGMLFASFDFSVKKAILEDKNLEESSNNLIIKTAKGGLYEALAADILIKRGIKELIFYKDEKNTMELEFFITNQDGIIPVEIKAGRSKANSLGNLLAKRDDIPYGYKLSSQNIGVVDKKITLPLYMLLFI